MDNHLFLKTLVERYLTNQATDQELEVFLELLKQGKLDDLIQTYLDQEADSRQSPNLETVVIGFLKRWYQEVQRTFVAWPLISQSARCSFLPLRFA
jgi:predicted NACHT family NTPase